MAKVRVKFYGILREIVGTREETLRVDDSLEAIEIVKLLASKHGRRFAETVFEKSGSLREGFSYAVNDKTVDESRIYLMKSKDVQTLVILPPISGG